ncbi:MAG: phage major capsid protein [Candidatus Peribacteria bacterium]|jgi:hypothetical protein|nr:phage major capsid protein [Candidatus Peribacteria bacterium]
MYITMNLLELIRNTLLPKDFKELSIKELALVVRHNNLVASKLSEGEILEKLEAEETIAKTLRKNSVTNTSETAGAASDFVPESVTVARLIDLSSDEGVQFLSLFSIYAQTLAGKTTTVPIIGTEEMAIVKTEATPTKSFREAKEGLQSANSAKVTITAQKLYTNIVVSDELSTFTIIELEALFIARLRRSITKAIGNAIINSDDTHNGNVNNKDVDVSTLTEYTTSTKYTYGKGLRALGLAGAEGVTKLNVGTITDIDFVFDLQGMVTSAEDFSEIALIMDRKTYNAIRKTEDYKNAAKNGSHSTIITGAVDIIAGSPVFVTSLLKLTDADGKISSVTPAKNTQGTIIAVDARVMQN